METKRIEPKSSKRSLELIVSQNPNMTGTEIQAELAYDKACYDLWIEQRDANHLTLANHLQEHKYFKIAYRGSSRLVVYLEITNAWIDNGIVYFDAISSQISRSGNDPKNIYIETCEDKSYSKWDNYVADCGEVLTELTKEQYEAFLTAVENLYNG